MTRPKVGELFAGYGGAFMGLQGIWPDAELTWVSEFEKAPSKVLEHRHPDAPNLGDITKIDWANVEPVDIITGGSPCQDLSHAGKRQGMKAGTRSGLWASMLEGINALRPSYVLWENVRGALSAEADSEMEPCAGCVGDGDDRTVLRALGRVLGDLAEIGYDAAWTGLRAADVGAPHGRFRVFVLAWPADSANFGLEWTRAARNGRHGLANGSAGDVEPPLLRTVMADEDGGGPLHPDVAKGRGQTLRLTGQILAMTGDLLPTPAVNDMGKAYTPDEWDEWTERMKSAHGNGNGHGKSLEIEAARLLPTVKATNNENRQTRSDTFHAGPNLGEAIRDTFGQYAPAIARWESVLDRPAPNPTEPTGRNGAARLSPRFTEFMMGVPDGWITDVPDVSRNDALKLCGNGIVPQQAEAAVRHLLDVRTTAYADIATASERVA